MWKMKIHYFIPAKVVLFPRNFYLILPCFRTSIFLQAKTVARILQDPITAFSGGSSKPGWS